MVGVFYSMGCDICGESTNLMENDEELHLSFLLSGSCQALPASYIKLRSYLNSHSAIIASHLNLKLPKYFMSKSISCPYCYLPWSQDTSFFKLLSEKKSANKRFKKNLTNDNEHSDRSLLRNTMVLKCKICCRKSSIPLVKKFKSLTPNVEEPKQIKEKKRKKKKDKSCGLKTTFLTQKLNSGSQSTKNYIKEKKKEQTNESNKQDSLKKQNHLSKNQNLNKISNSTFQLTKSEKTGKKFLNPYAANVNMKISKNHKKKLKQFQQAVKEEKNSVKKTLKDFLNLISN